MLDREDQFRKAFRFIKARAKEPLASTYTHGYSAGNGDKKPARIAYDYIVLLEANSSLSFEEKLEAYDVFLKKTQEDEEIQNPQLMGGSFYNRLRMCIKNARRDIENGKPVQTRVN